MNTQQIRDEIARLQGWKLPGDTGLLIDGTPVTLTAYHRQVFIETLNNYRYDKQNDHPIPDTIDAAVGVIEGAGFEVVNIDRSRTDVLAKAEQVGTFKGRIISVSHEHNGEQGAALLRPVLFKLALACVKAGNQPTKGLT